MNTRLKLKQILAIVLAFPIIILCLGLASTSIAYSTDTEILGEFREINQPEMGVTVSNMTIQFSPSGNPEPITSISKNSDLSFTVKTKILIDVEFKSDIKDSDLTIENYKNVTKFIYYENKYIFTPTKKETYKVSTIGKYSYDFKELGTFAKTKNTVTDDYRAPSESDMLKIAQNYYKQYLERDKQRRLEDTKTLYRMYDSEFWFQMVREKVFEPLPKNFWCGYPNVTESHPEAPDNSGVYERGQGQDQVKIDGGNCNVTVSLGSKLNEQDKKLIHDLITTNMESPGDVIYNDFLDFYDNCNKKWYSGIIDINGVDTHELDAELLRMKYEEGEIRLWQKFFPNKLPDLEKSVGYKIKYEPIKKKIEYKNKTIVYNFSIREGGLCVWYKIADPLFDLVEGGFYATAEEFNNKK